jgi:lipopolysaccharide biosynthesis glycosyltransferase
MTSADYDDSPGTSNSEVTIACTFDDAWVPQFATCAASIAASRGPERVHFIVVEGPGLSPKMAAAAGDFARDLGLSYETVVPDDQTIGSLPPAPLSGPIVWYRILLPGLLPQHDRVLSLDVDTLVLQSLAPLFAMELGDDLLAAVAAPSFGPEYREVVGLGPSDPCLNSGVMVLNLRAMRDDEIPARALAFGHEKGGALIYAEQDALTCIARNRWRKLHPRWNALSYLWAMEETAPEDYDPVELETARSSPAIVHFEGGQITKPWYYRCSHPLRHLYRGYRAQTPWPLERLENPSFAGFALRRLPIRLQYAASRFKTTLATRRAAA